MATDCHILVLLAQSTHLDQSTWIALLIGACATVFVMVRAKKPKRDPLERSSNTSQLSHERSVERQMSNLLIELTEMSRAISAGLDTRAAKLHALLDEADRKIAELKSLTSSAPRNATSSAMPREAPSRDALSGETTEERHAEIYALADQGRSVAQIAAELSRPRGEIELILALRPRPLTTQP